MKTQDYYYYSFTDKRTVVHTIKRGEYAFTAEAISLEKALNERLEGSFIVATIFGKHRKLKVESRQFKWSIQAWGWAEWIQSQNPKKEVLILELLT